MSENTKEMRFLKVGAVSPRIRLGDVAYNTKVCIEEAKRANDIGVELLLFPEFTLTGATCRDMLEHEIFIGRAERGLCEFMEATKELDTVSCISLPLGNLKNCIAVVYKGELRGIAPICYLPEWLDTDNACDDDGFTTLAGVRTELISDGTFLLPSDENITVGICGEYDGYTCLPDVVICPDFEKTIVGSRARRLDEARSFSKIEGTVYVSANAGFGESTTDSVFSAHNIIADRGDILAEAEPFATDNLIYADVLVAHLYYDEILEALDKVSLDGKTVKSHDTVKVPKLAPRRNMFLPENEEEQRTACLEAFEIQSRGLAARIERAYSKTMVIGVSGGLDSTLALLVCARAAEILGMDKKNIIGVTMPCFGTTKRTRSNAEKLCETLGITFRTVDIKASVIQHLKDIGHDGVTPDVTYENAQARERTQVIMDIANMTGGLVVGTGDLSELALGWATYNGDHMSMYAVNASVPKTMVRRIVEVYSERDRGEGGLSADILDDILATPVSPELLPPKDGEIAQCTEALVGPYELHDYFLYYLLDRKLSPAKIYENAKFDFNGVYDNKTILGWLRVFIRRFFSQQFKRSCMPDGPMVSCVSVSPRSGLSMPSDMSAAVWLEELDLIEKEEQ